MKADEVYIYKTTVRTKKAVGKLKGQLTSLLINCKWNFDLKDCDKILRVESRVNLSDSIIQLIKNNNYHCEELF